MSSKHLERYVEEFAGRHNIRYEDTLTQVGFVVGGMIGRLWKYSDLIEPTALQSGARL